MAIMKISSTLVLTFTFCCLAMGESTEQPIDAELTTTLAAEVQGQSSNPEVMTSVEVQGEPPVQTTMETPPSSTTIKAEPPLKYVGDPIPPNCTAFYSCCDMLNRLDGDCLKWCVKKVTCNKRLVLVRVPSYVEVVTDTPMESFVPSDTYGAGEDVANVENKNNVKAILGIKAVQVIDVPCISGLLPDRKGRCREKW